MDKFPYFKCSVPIISEKDIHGVAQIISDKLFKGIPFGGLENYIYEEVPAIYIDGSILGLEVVIQGFGGERGYILEVHNLPDIEPEDVDEKDIDITGYVASLLEGTNGIEIMYQHIKEKGYIKMTE